jgi:hypothetical protein
MVEEGESDRSQRWRKIAIDQLGYLLNLTLTFAIAALGYCFVLLKDRDFTPEHLAKHAMMVAIISLAVSALAGFICSLNRLLDFRATARRACDHPNEPNKDVTRDLGQVTWYMLYFQIVAFGVGIAALAISLLLTYGFKLI